jgi:hypothetical protein
MTATQLPPANAAAAPNPLPPGDHLAADHPCDEAHPALVGGNTLRSDQALRDAQTATVGADILADGQTTDAAHERGAAGNASPAIARPMPTEYAPGESVLQLAAATLDDIERTRIAMQNRLRAMRDDHGVGDTPEYARAELIYEALDDAEHQATLELQRALRRHPLGPWVKRTVGIGEKQGARLLAALDDPYWNHAEDRPRRGPAELWAYCGFAPGQKRKKGQKSNWNAQAKMRAFLVAESCIKHMHSPYRADYDRARASWADRETSDGHKHNHALRVVAKAVLRDLYLAAKGLA